MSQHLCHWPGCKTPVPLKLWGCKPHWFRLPSKLRALIWATYRPGQEVDKRPSEAYVRAARAVQKWIREAEHKHEFKEVIVPDGPVYYGQGDYHYERRCECGAQEATA